MMEKYNFDNPAALDWKGIKKTIEGYIHESTEIEMKEYDFKTKSSLGRKIKNDFPSVLIVEGIYGFNLFNDVSYDVEKYNLFCDSELEEEGECELNGELKGELGEGETDELGEGETDELGELKGELGELKGELGEGETDELGEDEWGEQEDEKFNSSNPLNNPQNNPLNKKIIKEGLITEEEGLVKEEEGLVKEEGLIRNTWKSKNCRKNCRIIKIGIKMPLSVLLEIRIERNKSRSSERDENVIKRFKTMVEPATKKWVYNSRVFKPDYLIERSDYSGSENEDLVIFEELKRRVRGGGVKL